MAERNRILMGFRFDLIAALLVVGRSFAGGVGRISPIAQSAKAEVVQQIAADERALSGGDIPVEAWPESWFQPPRRASQIGLTEFKQSPLLDSLVAAGELSPVAERLPDDPIVVYPINEIGRHGGTARLFYAGEQLINVPEGALRPGPQRMRLNLAQFRPKGRIQRRR